MQFVVNDCKSISYTAKKFHGDTIRTKGRRTDVESPIYTNVWEKPIRPNKGLLRPILGIVSKFRKAQSKTERERQKVTVQSYFVKPTKVTIQTKLI